jgi:alkyl hydroperoxide reductase subunit AhpC
LEHEFKFHKYIHNSWAILFSHPCDFTPVCATEIASLAKNQHEFSERHVKLVGLSVGDVQQHNLWIEDINHILRSDYPDELGLRVKFPIIADNGDVASKYDM